MTISAGALIGSSLIAGGSAVLNKLIEKKRYERQLADQHKLWQENNVYNSPSAQMARLKDAGLNPNLVYQNGGSVTPSDQITPPSFQTSPISEFNSVLPNAMQFTSIEADVDKKNAETAEILSNKGVQDTPLGQIESFKQLTDVKKNELADAFGVQPELMPSMSMRFISHMNELEQMSHNNKNLRQMLDIYKNETDITARQAMAASFELALSYLYTISEAHSRGYSVSATSAGKGSLSFEELKKRPGSVDAVAGSVIQNYNMILQELKNLKWENTGFRKGVRTFGDITSSIGSILPGIGSFLKKGTPTIRGIEREGYDKKRGRYIETINYNY